MTTIILARPTYPAQFTAAVESDHLEALKGSDFHTHTSIHAERLHRASEIVLLPGRYCAQFLARAIQPLPGKNKDQPLLGIAIRIVSVTLGIFLLPLAIVSLGLGLCLRSIDHRYRPLLGCIDNSFSKEAKPKKLDELVLTQEKPLTIRTHNVGFVTSSMSITGDLCPPEERARELIENVLGDPLKPDMIFFQETFHEDGTRILAEGLKDEYPYIIHSVAPQISGFNSGCMIASKYSIANAFFQRLDHAISPESASPKGILRVRVESAKGPLLLYSVHTQALLGEARAKARFNQLKEIRDLMESDRAKEGNVLQVIVGDFNTSRVTAWGDDNLTPGGQAEEEVLHRFDEYFDDVFLRDHDPLTGQRKAGQPRYLGTDNSRLHEDLEEPRGSWYHGPFADPGFLLSMKMSLDRQRHNRPAPQKVNEIAIQESTWGTRKWRSQQTANTARFDYVLFPKRQERVILDGRAEIRRVIVPEGAESAPSDHLPVDALIWIADSAQS